MTLFKHRYKCVTDFVNVGTKLLNTEMKETITRHTEDLAENTKLSSHEVAYSNNDASLFLLS
jgi:hypothetical protein